MLQFLGKSPTRMNYGQKPALFSNLLNRDAVRQEPGLPGVDGKGRSSYVEAGLWWSQIYASSNPAPTLSLVTEFPYPRNPDLDGGVECCRDLGERSAAVPTENTARAPSPTEKAKPDPEHPSCLQAWGIRGFSKDPNELRSVEHDSAEVLCACTTGANCVAVGCSDDRIRLYDLGGTDESASKLLGHQSRVWCL